MWFAKRTLVPAFVLCLAVPFFTGGPFAEGQTGISPRLIVYDIPSQDLAKALGSFAATSGMQVLYEAPLVKGRRSAAVKGALSPEAALYMMLSDSGLVGQRTDFDAITIAPAPLPEKPGVLVLVLPDARFLGALQAAILEALCGSDETRPGAYRMGLQLWITPESSVERAVLLGSTGDLRRDAALERALRNLAIGARAPVGMAQPVTLAIVPRQPRENGECAGR